MLRYGMSSTRSRPALTTGSPSASFRALMCGLRAVESKPTYHIGLVGWRTVERPQDNVMDLGGRKVDGPSRGDSVSCRSGLSAPSGSASAWAEAVRTGAGASAGRSHSVMGHEGACRGETDVEIAAAVLAQHI